MIRQLGSFHDYSPSPGVKLRYFRSSFQDSEAHKKTVKESDRAQSEDLKLSETRRPKGSLVILPGRASFIEKYVEIIEYWVSKGYEVWCLDWRGQGGSSRILPNSKMVHIDDYSIYLKDLDQWLTEVVLPQSVRPLNLYAVSMSGLIAGLYLEEATQACKQIQAAVFVVPMFGLPTRPFSKGAAELLAKTACRLGLSKRHVFGHGKITDDQLDLPLSVQASLKEQEQSVSGFRSSDLFTYGLTYGWLDATFRALKTFADPRRLKAIQTPLLVVRAGQEIVVDNRGDLEMCRQIPKCEVETYEDAEHGIHFGDKGVRDRLLEKSRRFLERPLHSPEAAN